jgi:hypothetical protein
VLGRIERLLAMMLGVLDNRYQILLILQSFSIGQRCIFLLHFGNYPKDPRIKSVSQSVSQHVLDAVCNRSH